MKHTVGFALLAFAAYVALVAASAQGSPTGLAIGTRGMRKLLSTSTAKRFSTDGPDDDSFSASEVAAEVSNFKSSMALSASKSGDDRRKLMLLQAADSSSAVNADGAGDVNISAANVAAEVSNFKSSMAVSASKSGDDRRRQLLAISDSSSSTDGQDDDSFSEAGVAAEVSNFKSSMAVSASRAGDDRRKLMVRGRKLLQ
ncbi:hypothetical protein OEZ85_004626 [Tetradesmus obliquus]|uniref:RxLR effector protein n=1 Tax=Tetradesmus obliquus TaxID=3088 RepID=A0ABY8UMH8_TETOB|nr:hypothetical protein OEZ85_004626 [Tetradesmus obliquus]